MAGVERSGADSRKPRVVLGVSGGIAAYKACELLRRFTESDHDVTVALLADAEARDRSASVGPVITSAVLSQMSERVHRVHVDPAILSYVAHLAEESRRHPHVILGLSVRGGLAFIRCAKTWAISQGRPYVTPDDIRDLAQPILGHRLLLGDEAQFTGVRVADVVDDLMSDVAAPAYRAR